MTETFKDNAGESLSKWRDNVRIAPVSEYTDCHTIHTYFNISPESPDGRYVLFYHSTTPEGHAGELRILERATGEEHVIARDIATEDAHRVAAQQWVSMGHGVVFQNERNGKWFTVHIDVTSGEKRVLAEDRLVSWGSAMGDVVPIYGPHWSPGKHRDLQLANVSTGEIRTYITSEQVRAQYPEFCQQKYGEQSTSIFFPILSPDQRRVMFKLSAAKSGSVRSKDASNRSGMIFYDLDQRRFLGLHERWGHPAWMNDSRHITQMDNQVIDSTTGESRMIPNLPTFAGAHPSPSPDGSLIVTDYRDGNDWGVAVCDTHGGGHVMLHRFDNTGGAKSWRPTHPHPVFSRDGKRIYFNVSAGQWTRLFVAEIAS